MTASTRAAILGILGALWFLGALWILAAPARAQEPFRHGDVFTGVPDGRISPFSAAGAPRRPIGTGGGQMAGMCFDLDGNLYATDFTGGTMVKIDESGRVVARRWGGPFSTHPESCVVDAQGNVYTGEVEGENKVRKFDPAGRLLGTFRPRTESRGVDWIDLAADQCTLFYTSEGRKVMRYDVCRDRQLDDFADGLDRPCYALRVRENGEVMVACHSRVYRLDARGRILGSYAIAGEHLFAMNLDPDGEHFWTGGLFSGNVYKVHVGSGRGTARPLFGALKGGKREPSNFLDTLFSLFDQAAMGGLAVYGERTAAVVEEVRRREVAERRESQEAERRRREAEARAAEAATEAERRRREAAERQAAAEAAEAELERLRAEQERLAAEQERREAERRAAAEAAAEAERRRLEAERKKREGTVAFGAPRAVDLGRLEPEASARGELVLAGSRVEGSPTARVTTDLEAAGVALEIETAEGWRPLGRQAVELPLEEGSEPRWPLRLRVGSCTEGVSEGASHHLRIEARGPDRAPATLEVPLALRVEPSPWLRCWGPAVAGALGLLLLGVVAHGFVSPSRFAPRIGVVLSPEEDMGEGFFHPIRAQRGSRSGFYRDARIYVARDYRLTRKAAGTLARLRAAGQQVRLQPIAGVALERRTADGEWQAVAAEEARMRPGVVYRDELKSLFFELRNR